MIWRYLIKMYFCSLSSGSSGNCMYVGNDKNKILIDVGLSKKQIMTSLGFINVKLKSIDGVLITHEHLDHCKGLSALSKDYNLPVYLNRGTYEAILNKGYNIKNMVIIENDEFCIGDLDIKTFRVPHDAVDPVGYTIMNKNRKISIVTDVGYISNEIFDNIKNSNVILIESNYNEYMVKMSSYPQFLKDRILGEYGHLSNEECGNIVVELIKNFPKRIILGHLSKTNNFPELAYKTVEKIVSTNGFEVGKDLKLTVAHRDLPSNYLRV